MKSEYIGLMNLMRYVWNGLHDSSWSAEWRKSSTEDVTSEVQRKVKELPQLAFIVSEVTVEEQILLTLSFHLLMKHHAVNELEEDAASNLQCWYELIKCLIEINPHALTWTIGFDKDVLVVDKITVHHGVSEPIVDFIARRYMWVFGRVQQGKHPDSQFENKGFDPASRLMIYHVNGVVPASSVKAYCELSPQALVSHAEFGTLLHCALRIEERVCCANLFKSMAKQVPQAMMTLDKWQQTPLDIACHRLARVRPFHLYEEDSILDLTEICLYLISECPQAIFMENCHNMTPLDILSFGVDEETLAFSDGLHLVVCEMLKTIHRLHPGCMLPGRCEEGTSWGYEYIRHMNPFFKFQYLLRQEYRNISIARGLLKSVKNSSFGEAYMCWSSSRLQAVNAEVVSVSPHHEEFRTKTLLWEQERYCPFDDWRLTT